MSHLTVEEVSIIREVLIEKAKSLSKGKDRSSRIEKLNTIANKIFNFEVK